MAGNRPDDVTPLLRALDAWMNADPRNRELALTLAAYVQRSQQGTPDERPPVGRAAATPGRDGRVGQRGQLDPTRESTPDRAPPSSQESARPPDQAPGRVQVEKGAPTRGKKVGVRSLQGGLHSHDPITRELLEAVAPELESLGVMPRGERDLGEKRDTNPANSARPPTLLETLAPDAARALTAHFSELSATRQQVKLEGKVDGKPEVKPDAKLVGGLAQHPMTAPGVAPPHKEPVITRHTDAVVSPVTSAAPDPYHKQSLLVQRAEFHLAQHAKCYVQRDMKAAVLHIQRIIETLEEYAASAPIAAEAPMGVVLASAIDALTPKLALPSADERRLAAILARLDAQEEADDGPLIHPSAASLVRPLLAGRVAVIIAGERREDRQRALITDLALRDLRWLRSQPGKASTQFEADIKRPEVTLVLLAIRWVRHGTADAVVAAARKHNKPLVRLPGGMGSNAVAHCVLTQVGAGLGTLM
jgi:hypothetical protein